MKFPRHLIFLTLPAASLTALASQPPGWAANIHVSATAEASWVENASRTSLASTRQDAALYEVAVNLTTPRQLAPAWLAQLGLDTRFTAEPEFSLNNRLAAGPRASLQYKFGLGPYAPTLEASASVLYHDVRLGAASGWVATTGLRLAKRFSPTFRASLFADWNESYARSAVFDVQQHTLGLEAAWDFTERWRISVSASRLSGDIVTNAAPATWAQAISGGLGATVSDYYTTVAWDVTDLYGQNWVSYNVAADVDLWSTTLDYRINDDTTLGLSLRSAYVVNRIDVRYPSKAWTLNLNHRF